MVLSFCIGKKNRDEGCINTGSVITDGKYFTFFLRTYCAFTYFLSVKAIKRTKMAKKNEYRATDITAKKETPEAKKKDFGNDIPGLLSAILAKLDEICDKMGGKNG